MSVLDEDDGDEWEGSRCRGCKRYEDGTVLLRALVCNAVGEEGFSNNIKADKYRTRPYVIYTTLGMGARTMFVHVSQECGEIVRKEWLDRTIDCRKPSGSWEQMNQLNDRVHE